MKTQVSLPLILAALLVAAPFGMFAQKAGNEMSVIGKGTKADELLAKDFPPGSQHQFTMVPMRDGVKLATDVFIPPGNGPWPVVFVRGYYGRLNAGFDVKAMQTGSYVYICQDARGQYDSEGKDTIKYGLPDTEINDSSDSLDWIAAQKWCNGKIGMVGASGNAVGPFAAFLSKNPHLIVANSSISNPWPYYYWGFHNGVRRFLYEWLQHDALKINEWPKPTIPNYNVARLKEVLNAAADKNPVPIVLSCGWYDISPEATIDAYTTCASTSRIFATIAPGGHGGHCPFTWPMNQKKNNPFIPTIYDVLIDKAKLPEKSEITYFVMGNYRDPNSPGNYYRTTDKWPVPNTPTPYYFHADGSLSTAKPTQADATLTYAYDPKDPSPSIGITESLQSGPFDQRPLKDRKDVLHFSTPPLTAPVEVTGKIIADLYISTDVPDTEFVVKFIDIQPDGYEMMIRESPILGRYAEEFQGKPAPLEKGKVYHLKVDMRTTSIILDKGHKLGVLVTSSSKPEYEVHPNTFETVTNFDKSPVAHQVIQLSSQYPSSITLPVVTGGKP